MLNATHACCRKLCLLLRPPNLPDFSIRLIPVIAPDTFPLAKLAPERNSLRCATAAARLATAVANKPSPAAALTTAVVADPSAGTKGQKRKRAEAELDTPAAHKQAGAQAVSQSVAQDDVVRLPNPQYNTSIIADMMIEQHQHTLQSSLEAVPKLSEAIVLLKVLSQSCDFTFAVD